MAFEVQAFSFYSASDFSVWTPKCCRKSREYWAGMAPMKTHSLGWQRRSSLCPSKVFVWGKETCRLQTILRNIFSVFWIVQILSTCQVRMLFMNVTTKSCLLNKLCQKEWRFLMTKFVQVCSKRYFIIACGKTAQVGLLRQTCYRIFVTMRQKLGLGPFRPWWWYYGRRAKGEIFMTCRKCWGTLVCLVRSPGRGVTNYCLEWRHGKPNGARALVVFACSHKDLLFNFK